MKKVYDKEEGIASVIGTIFALMIFTALLGMFMTQVVPVTMKENEAQHDQQVLSQLSTLRSVVDILTMTKDTNYTAYVPIKLGADGIPFFASPTYGQLGLYPSVPNGNTSHMISLKFTDMYGNVMWKNSSGSLQFISPNKYYDAEIFEYADGGIMRYNYIAKSSVFAINPNINFEKQDLGYALSFPHKSGTYVQIPDSKSLDIVGPLTLEAWVYIKSGGTQYIITHGGYFTLWIKSNNGIRFADTYGHYVDTNPLPSKYFNKWIHIAAVLNGTYGSAMNKDTAQIYIDGNPMGASWGGTWQPDSTKHTTTTIGNDFNGYIDEVRIVNASLTQDDVEKDYYAGHYYPYVRNTAAWYHFDEGSVSGPIVDSSDNHNNGTVKGPVTPIKLDGINIAATLQNIYGTPAVLTGTDTRSIGISLQGVYSQSFDIMGTLNITVRDYYQYSTSHSFNFTSNWISSLTDMLNNTGLKEGIDYQVSGNVISIDYVNTATINMVYMIMNIER